MSDFLNQKKNSAGCSECDKGLIRKRNEDGFGFESAIYCDCFIESESLTHSASLLKVSNISERFIKRYDATKWVQPKDLDFDTLDAMLSEDTIEKNWLFFYGPAGTGKTYASIVAAKIAVLREKEVFFATVPDLLNMLRPSGTEAEGNIRYIAMRNCKLADLLILDDIGQEKSSQWVREQLYIIINHRYNEGLPTIFTSNFPLSRIETNISSAVHSRIKAEATVVDFTPEENRRV